MRILDQNDIEIQESEVDTSKGYLVADKIFVQHHEAVEAQPAETHYECKTFYFDDGTSLDVSALKNQDPHVKVIDAKNGVFEYVDQGEGKVFKGLDIDNVVDKEKVEAKEAYDEYEDIQRYILYTQEELDQQQAQQEHATLQEKQNSQLMTVATMFMTSFAPSLTDEQALSVSSFIPTWTIGQTYAIKDIVQYNNTLYRALNNSTAEAQYTPDVYTSGWKEILPASEGSDIYPWVQPLGSTDAYSKGDKVTFEGKTYESIIDSNVWSPTTYGWKEVENTTDGDGTEEPENPETTEYPEWIQPTGAHDAYAKGDKVTYNGKVYESTTDGNVWSPDAYGWTEVTE